jgi:hypothetical protein
MLKTFQIQPYNWHYSFKKYEFFFNILFLKRQNAFVLYVKEKIYIYKFEYLKQVRCGTLPGHDLSRSNNTRTRLFSNSTDNSEMVNVTENSNVVVVER